MNGNNMDQSQREQFARAAALGIGAAVGSAALGPVGALFGAVSAFFVADALLKPGIGPSLVPLAKKFPYFVILALRTGSSHKFSSVDFPDPEKGIYLERDICELLYEKSKYIWRGTQAELEANKFVDILQGKGVPVAKPGDESAFRLVALQLDEDIPGLARGVSSLDRRDAFLKLAGKAKVVGVSPLVYLESLTKKGFYPV
ncbi:MAG TPA: hypothetical protein IGR15_05150 [Synechococcus sp. M44_DOE_062]|nr:hypothetical protein [Synechococcus sp. M44_DOE_062]